MSNAPQVSRAALVYEAIRINGKIAYDAAFEHMAAKSGYTVEEIEEVVAADPNGKAATFHRALVESSFPTLIDLALAAFPA